MKIHVNEFTLLAIVLFYTANMTEPTHIFIKRDAAAVEVSSVVQKAGEYLNDEDKTPFIIHKV